MASIVGVTMSNPAVALTLAPTRPAPSVQGLIGGLGRLLPGLGLCLAVTGAAVALEHAEAAVFGSTWLEALVLAILVGTAVRTAWTPGQLWFAGIDFGAKTLLEIAVLLLGASISAGMILAAGPSLIAGIAAVVVLAIAGSYGIGRLLGLPHRMAMLVACGNSICGNSAIAAVAPIIGADGEDVAASIAFTAVLGVLVVLGLPLLPAVLHLTGLQYGVLAGLTVYAVPQVLAATAPIGTVAVHMGTLVKLVRVLMLGPIVLGLSLLTRRLRDETDEAPPHLTAGDRPAPGQAAAAQAGAVVHRRISRAGRAAVGGRRAPCGPRSHGGCSQPADDRVDGRTRPWYRPAGGGPGRRAGDRRGYAQLAGAGCDQPRTYPPAGHRMTSAP